MSNLQNKSEFNKDAAKLLHDKCNFAPVPHCAYYSCLQLMKHIWLHVMKKSENELSMLTSCSTTNEGSHEVLLNQICLHLKSKKLNSRIVRNSIGQLKRTRVESDYSDLQIDIKKSNDSIDLSSTVLKELKKC